MFLSHEMKCYLQCRRQIFMFRAFLRAKNTNAVRAKNTNAVFSATKQWRECKAKDAESFFLSERKVLNSILRLKLKYMKDVSFSWNEMLFAMQKTDFHVLELFCRANHVRASMHRITSLELLSTLMICLVQLSKWRECKAKDAEKLLSQWEKVANELFCRASNVRATMHRITGLDLLRTLMLCLVQLSKWRESKATDAEKASQWEKVAKCNFKSNAQVHERCFFLMKWNVICNAEDRFQFRAFLRAKNTNAVRAKEH